jgi:hypothetical protein
VARLRLIGDSSSVVAATLALAALLAVALFSLGESAALRLWSALAAAGRRPLLLLLFLAAAAGAGLVRLLPAACGLCPVRGGALLELQFFLLSPCCIDSQSEVCRRSSVLLVERGTGSSSWQFFFVYLLLLLLLLLLSPLAEGGGGHRRGVVVGEGGQPLAVASCGVALAMLAQLLLVVVRRRKGRRRRRVLLLLVVDRACGQRLEQQGSVRSAAQAPGGLFSPSLLAALRCVGRSSSSSSGELVPVQLLLFSSSSCVPLAIVGGVPLQQGAHTLMQSSRQHQRRRQYGVHGQPDLAAFFHLALVRYVRVLVSRPSISFVVFVVFVIVIVVIIIGFVLVVEGGSADSGRCMIRCGVGGRGRSRFQLVCVLADGGGCACLRCVGSPRHGRLLEAEACGRGPPS